MNKIESEIRVTSGCSLSFYFIQISYYLLFYY